MNKDISGFIGWIVFVMILVGGVIVLGYYVIPTYETGCLDKFAQAYCGTNQVERLILTKDDEGFECGIYSRTDNPRVKPNLVMTVNYQFLQSEIDYCLIKPAYSFEKIEGSED